MRAFLFSFVLLSGPAFAAPDDLVVVTASRAPERLSAVGQSVTVIGSEELQRRQAYSVVEALRLVPGVAFSRNGGTGTATALYIRGAETDQAVSLIDGVKVNDPAAVGGGFNFGPLLTGNLERIELLRGPASVVWGSQAIGGVVHLITRSPGETLAGNVRGEIGWRNSYELVGNVSGKTGPLAASVGAGWFRSDGVSAFNESRGGRERDGFENIGANGRLSLAVNADIDLEARGFFAKARTDIDGFPAPLFAFADTADVARSTQFVGYAGTNVRLFDGRLANRFGYAHTIIDREDRNRANPASGFDALGRTERFEYQGVLTLGMGRLVFGAEREQSRLFNQSRGGAPLRARARIDSLYLQANLAPVEGVDLGAGVRHDDHDQFGGSTIFSASASLTPNGGATRLRASYAEGFKAPSLFQLFSSFGNPSLAPEQSASVDAGLTQRLLGDGVEISATWFRRLTRNQIDFVSCTGNPAAFCAGRPFGTYDSIRRTKGQGVELAMTLRPVAGVTAVAGYTFLDAINRDNGRQLARRPRNTAQLVLDADLGAGLSLGGNIQIVDARFDDPANARRLPGHALVDLRAAWAISERLELYGRIENLFDERYETVFLYGTAGRSAFVGLRARL